MIRILTAREESRTRDVPRGRYILIIGHRVYHVTREELVSLKKRISKLMRKKK